MALATIYTQEMIKEYLEKGYWEDKVTADYCDENALKYPEREALADPKMRLTWHDVKTLSDRLALGLIDMGFGRDEVLMVQLYNCVEQFLLRVACEKAGIVYGFGPITFRENELKSIMNHIQAKGVVIPRIFHRFDYLQMMRDLKPSVPTLRHILIAGDDAPGDAVKLSDMLLSPLEKKFPTDHLRKRKFNAFETSQIFPTSGTTGVPKCLEWTGAGRLATGRVYVKRLKLTPETVLCCLGPFSAGGNTTLCYRAAPVAGAKVVFLKEFTPEDACSLMEKERAYGASLVPTLLIRLLNYPDLGKYDLSSLRFILTATAPLPLPVALEAERRLNVVMVDAYGSSESGSATVTRLDDPQRKRISTLQPMEGVKVQIRDEKGNALPPGNVGDVFLGGAHLSGGYFRSPEMTKRTWPDGWVDMQELGRLDHEGNLVLVGRKRDTIIRGGQNIYPKEIEDLIMQHPKVVEAAVVAMPDAEMGQRACAYVVPKIGQTFTLEEMSAYLKSLRMAMFKLPERLELVVALPLAPGGQKVDKKVLEKAIQEKLEREGHGKTVL